MSANDDTLSDVEVCMSLAHKKKGAEQLVKVTAWVPERQMRRLMKTAGGIKNQSGLLRTLIENEVERIESQKAHASLYGIAAKGDFDDSVL